MFCSACGKPGYVKTSLGKEVKCNKAMCNYAKYFKLGESLEEICMVVKNKRHPVGTYFNYIFALTNEEIDDVQLTTKDISGHTIDYIIDLDKIMLNGTIPQFYELDEHYETIDDVSQTDIDTINLEMISQLDKHTNLINY